MPRSELQTLEVWGDLGCFTRPEMKVERMSYPVITPSAARGIFDAIYWKPALKWRVRRIELLSPPRFIALRRNEVKSTGPSERTVTGWERGAMPEPLVVEDDRTQRQTMALKSLRYRLHAEIVAWPDRGSELQGMVAQFRRRAERGQCFVQPCFGCREFPAYFRLVAANEPAVSPYPLDMNVGWMIYDVFEQGHRGHANEKPSISVFQALIRGGVLEIPDYGDPAVRRQELTHAG